ncbi:hypothetical protein FGB62_186g026 [Gracilaria domingensis]|nr:hypothetical protein FGB62_186g026 [Gracilaria domingensis]
MASPSGRFSGDVMMRRLAMGSEKNSDQHLVDGVEQPVSIPRAQRVLEGLQLAVEEHDGRDVRRRLGAKQPKHRREQADSSGGENQRKADWMDARKRLPQRRAPGGKRLDHGARGAPARHGGGEGRHVARTRTVARGAPPAGAAAVKRSAGDAARAMPRAISSARCAHMRAARTRAMRGRVCHASARRARAHLRAASASRAGVGRAARAVTPNVLFTRRSAEAQARRERERPETRRCLTSHGDAAAAAPAPQPRRGRASSRAAHARGRGQARVGRRRRARRRAVPAHSAVPPLEEDARVAHARRAGAAVFRRRLPPAWRCVSGFPCAPRTNGPAAPALARWQPLGAGLTADCFLGRGGRTARSRRCSTADTNPASQQEQPAQHDRSSVAADTNPASQQEQPAQRDQKPDADALRQQQQPEEQPAQALNAQPASQPEHPAEQSEAQDTDSDTPQDHAVEQSAQTQHAGSAPQHQNVAVAEEPVAAEQQQSTDESGKIAVDAVQPVRADVSLMVTQRQKYDQAAMSIVVLFHNEYESMKTSLKSWLDNGLIDYAQEILFFLNGVEDDKEFLKQITLVEQIPKEKRRIHVSSQNLPLGQAITKMVDLASSEYVLLLEKDWKLIEPAHITKSRLIDSKVLVGSGVAHLVRHRHRHDPGVPLHAQIMHQGREESILRQQPNLLCFVHHWQDDPPNAYPGKGIMHRCGGVERNVDEEDVYCSAGKYCQWNNNPGLFKRKWFMDEIGREYLKQYKIEFDKHGITSPFLDFEYYTNWRPYAWDDKNFTIAVGTGLFSHAESEHKYFNTFWYAHFRLETDMEEVRNQYLKNETRFKQLGGVHYDPAYPKPLTMMERYPVEFVREFQFEDMYTGTLDTQRKMIDERGMGQGGRCQVEEGNVCCELESAHHQAAHHCGKGDDACTRANAV